MKKLISFMFVLTIGMGLFYAQTNISVDITDNVYNILSASEQKNLCTKLSNTRPYTQKYIVQKLNEILSNLQNQEESYAVRIQKKEIQKQLNKFQVKKGFDFSRFNYNFSATEENPVTLNLGASYTTQGFGGVYDISESSSGGFETYGSINICGDFGKNVSYRTYGNLGLSRMPLEFLGTYDIGKYWYSVDEEGNPDDTIRTINKFQNNSCLPYTYKKFWDGSVYSIGILSTGGDLNGWCNEISLAFSMLGDLRTTLLNDNIEIGIARQDREWAAMDNGSSLVLNGMARPFTGFDAKFKITPYFTLSTLFGSLEFPNQGYINSNAFPSHGEIHNDSYYFQTNYAVTLLEADFKNFHADFGSASIFPKRFELGYFFPFVDKVVFQNNVGDYDNLSLFANVKYTLPEYFSVWGSFFLDETFGLKTNIFEMERCMFAYQGGVKANIPWLPFGKVSLRYTKVEPYCYTHQSLLNQPYYDDYVSESYTNNGSCIGYYMPPNSDEILLNFEFVPEVNSTCGLRYQFSRHGADYGSQQVLGSSIYSELNPVGERATLKKYFLHDGTYQWTNAISVYGSYDMSDFKIPVQFNMSVGYVNSFFTSIGSVTRDEANWKTPYSKINTDEYPVKNGCVVNLGFKAFF